MLASASLTAHFFVSASTGAAEHKVRKIRASDYHNKPRNSEGIIHIEVRRFFAAPLNGFFRRNNRSRDLR